MNHQSDFQGIVAGLLAFIWFFIWVLSYVIAVDQREARVGMGLFVGFTAVLGAYAWLLYMCGAFAEILP